MIFRKSVRFDEKWGRPTFVIVDEAGEVIGSPFRSERERDKEYDRLVEINEIEV